MTMSLLSARKRLCSVRNGGLKVGSSWDWDKHADRASKRKQKSAKQKQKRCNPVEGEGRPSSSISCHVCRSKLVSQLTLFEFWFCIIQRMRFLTPASNVNRAYIIASTVAFLGRQKKNCADKFCFSFLNPFPSEDSRNDLAVEA